VSGADGNRVYALIENEPEGGLFVSDDAGASWKKINDNRNIRQRAFYYTRVYADPKVKDTVWILNVNIYKSTDAGKTITNVRVPHGDNHDMWIAPSDSNRMIEANDGGANVSVNGGQTWTDQDYPTAQFYHVFLTSHIPYQICGAQQDNSTACMSSQAGSFGQDTYYYDVGGGESGYIAPDPLDPDVYYAGSYGGLLTRFDRRTGQQRNINIWPDNPMGYGSAASRSVSSGRSRSSSRRWTRRRFMPRRRASGRRPTPGRRGRGSVRTCPATIRRRWAPRAGRSPRTTPVSRPMEWCSRSRRRRKTSTRSGRDQTTA
jgi:hypothetical protein